MRLDFLTESSYLVAHSSAEHLDTDVVLFLRALDDLLPVLLTAVAQTHITFQSKSSCKKHLMLKETVVCNVYLHNDKNDLTFFKQIVASGTKRTNMHYAICRMVEWPQMFLFRFRWEQGKTWPLFQRLSSKYFLLNTMYNLTFSLFPGNRYYNQRG